MPANSAFMGWEYDSLGNLIRLGKTSRTLDWSIVYDTALPSWLTYQYDNSGGSVAVTPVGSGQPGSCRVSSSTTKANNWLGAPAIDVAQFSEVGLYVDDLTFDTDSISAGSFAMGFINPATTIGVGYGHQNTVGPAALFFNGSASANKEFDPIETPFFGANGVNAGSGLSTKKSYGVIYRPVEQAVYLVNSERGVMWRQQCQNPSACYPATTVLTPSIGSYNSDSAAHYFQFTRIRLELISG